MDNSNHIPLGPGSYAMHFPSAVVIFNYPGQEADEKIARLVSGSAGQAVIFLCKSFDKNVFSQAEGRNRAFIFSTKFVDKDSVDPTYPAQWVSPGEIMPGLPGNLSLKATDQGFKVESLPPDPPMTAYLL